MENKLGNAIARYSAMATLRDGNGTVWIDVVIKDLREIASAQGGQVVDRDTSRLVDRIKLAMGNARTASLAPGLPDTDYRHQIGAHEALAALLGELLRGDFNSAALSAPVVDEPSLTACYKTIERMAFLYKRNPGHVAEICDEKLDHSGNLLGYLREAAIEINHGIFTKADLDCEKSVGIERVKAAWDAYCDWLKHTGRGMGSNEFLAIDTEIAALNTPQGPDSPAIKPEDAAMDDGPYKWEISPHPFWPRDFDSFVTDDDKKALAGALRQLN